jgi:hypothetical protein
MYVSYTNTGERRFVRIDVCAKHDTYEDQLLRPSAPTRLPTFGLVFVPYWPRDDSENLQNWPVDVEQVARGTLWLQGH